jgi:hypothetical protein
MKETGLRWKGRIGSLKILGFIVAIGACIILAAGASTLNLALKNPDNEPQKVTISQMVNGEIGSGLYVRVSGTAEYDVGYEETEDGKTTRNFYFLIDPYAGDMILIEHHSPYIVDLESGNSATITGMTRNVPSDLKGAIEDDMDTYHEYDLETTTNIYVKDGATPPTTASGVTSLCISIPALLLCVIPFLFPSTVFGPYPVDTALAPSAGRAKVRATGKFQKLKQLEPTIEIGKGNQKLVNAVANVVPLAQGRLMIYIHRIVRSRYGITSESDWGIFLDTSNVHTIEPGKIYSWKDKWAVRVRYQGPKDKMETLFVMFEQPGDHAGFVNLLQQSGFTVETVETAA